MFFSGFERLWITRGKPRHNTWITCADHACRKPMCKTHGFVHRFSASLHSVERCEELVSTEPTFFCGLLWKRGKPAHIAAKRRLTTSSDRLYVDKPGDDGPGCTHRQPLTVHIFVVHISTAPVTTNTSFLKISLFLFLVGNVDKSPPEPCSAKSSFLTPLRVV